MGVKQPNQLDRRHMGIISLNSFVRNNSSSRIQMYASHLGQTLVIKDSTERRIQTGEEREFAKYTFSVKMPVDGDIIRVIPRYQRTLGPDSIDHNPQTVVIYEDQATKEVGVLNFTDFCSHHQHFGFPYKATRAISEVRNKAPIRKGTVFLDSPSVNERGGYQYGLEANVAFMTHPAVSEDGVLVSRDFLPKMGIKTYETRIIEFGNDMYPLNTYGTPGNFKAFPDIGEYVRPDGMLMALRSYDPDLAVVEQNIFDLCEVDATFDRTIYADGEGGRIIDIRVHHDVQNPNPTTPAGMEVQAEKYDRQRRTFYQAIMNEYNRLRTERGQFLKVTPEFDRLIVEAISVLGETEARQGSKPQRIIKLCGKNPLDDWRIEFVIEYDKTPVEGFKLTDTHGGRLQCLFR